MKPSEIISLARRQTGCTEDIVTADEAYKFLNFVIEDFWADIRASDSWYWFDFLPLDVTAWSSVYPIDEDAGEWFNKFPISKLQKVWYLMPDWKWRDLPIHFVDKIDINHRPDDWEPRICFIVNNTVNLIPTPKENTQMQLWGFDYNWEIYNIPAIETNYNKFYRNTEFDLTGKTYNYAWVSQDSYLVYTATESTPSGNAYSYNSQTDTFTSEWVITKYWENWYDEEENIWIPRRWHYILVEWLKYRMYGNMWVNFETPRANARVFYDNEKMKALQNIVDRGQEADTAYLPNLNFLNY